MIMNIKTLVTLRIKMKDYNYNEVDVTISDCEKEINYLN